VVVGGGIEVAAGEDLVRVEGVEAPLRRVVGTMVVEMDVRSAMRALRRAKGSIAGQRDGGKMKGVCC